MGRGHNPDDRPQILAVHWPDRHLCHDALDRGWRDHSRLRNPCWL